MRLEFTLSEEELPFNFFDKIDFCYQSVVIECIIEKYPNLNEEQAQEICEQNIDAINDEIMELKRGFVILGNCYEEVEVDEGRGTWGYFKYDIFNVENERKELAEETRELMRAFLKKAKLKM
jgi:hypothetical protein